MNCLNCGQIDYPVNMILITFWCSYFILFERQIETREVSHNCCFTLQALTKTRLSQAGAGSQELNVASTCGDRRPVALMPLKVHMSGRLEWRVEPELRPSQASPVAV